MSVARQCDAVSLHVMQRERRCAEGGAGLRWLGAHLAVRRLTPSPYSFPVSRFSRAQTASSSGWGPMRSALPPGPHRPFPADPPWTETVDLRVITYASLSTHRVKVVRACGQANLLDCLGHRCRSGSCVGEGSAPNDRHGSRWWIRLRPAHEARWRGCRCRRSPPHHLRAWWLHRQRPGRGHARGRNPDGSTPRRVQPSGPPGRPEDLPPRRPA